MSTKASTQVEQDPSFRELQHDINKIGYDLKYMSAHRAQNEFNVNHR
jgi:uncharacterized membrane protein